MTTYQLITTSAAIELLTTIESDDHQSAVEQLRDWAGANGYRLATGPGEVEATCTFMQDTGWFDFDDVQSRADQSIQPTKSKEITMVTLKEFCENDPAVAIKALIDGLMRYESIDEFCLDFSCKEDCGWGDEEFRGGAPVLVLMELLELDDACPALDYANDRAELFSTDVRDLSDFEEAIYHFSIGIPRAIEQYFGILISGIEELPWNLQSNDFEEDLLEIINFWEKLTGQKYQQSRKSLDDRWNEAISATQRLVATVH
jgi:hypothetical protein